jgi:nitrile hydratase
VISQQWLAGIIACLLEQGYITQEELDAAAERYRADPDAPLPDSAEPAIDDQVIRYLREGDSPRRGPGAPAFTVGDPVLVRNRPASDTPGSPATCAGTLAPSSASSRATTPTSARPAPTA